MLGLFRGPNLLFHKSPECYSEQQRNSAEVGGAGAEC